MLRAAATQAGIMIGRYPAFGSVALHFSARASSSRRINSDAASHWTALRKMAFASGIVGPGGANP